MIRGDYYTLVAVLLVGAPHEAGAGSVQLSTSAVALAAIKQNEPKAVRKAKAEQELEAIMLQMLIGPAFPAMNGMFGGGLGAKHWRTMMLEHVARAITASGQLKITPGRHRAMRAPERLRLLPGPGLGPQIESGSGWETTTIPSPVATTAQYFQLHIAPKQIEHTK